MGRLLCELEFSPFGCRAGDGEGLDHLVILVNFMNLQILLQMNRFTCHTFHTSSA